MGTVNALDERYKKETQRIKERLEDVKNQLEEHEQNDIILLEKKREAITKLIDRADAFWDRVTDDGEPPPTELEIKTLFRALALHSPAAVEKLFSRFKSY
jgi:hypothetical protein